MGFRYWMACTPYPYGDDRAENPILRVSQDGVQWSAVPGAPDPLVPPPIDEQWHHADTDLVLHEDRLYVFFISVRRSYSDTTFSVISSRDGTTWSSPETVYSGSWGVSPAVLVHDNIWHLWFIRLDTNDRRAKSALLLRKGADPLRLGNERPCALALPGYTPWHVDIIRVDDGFEALIAAFPDGTNPSRCRLFHAESSDGVGWRLSNPAPMLSPSLFGWDNRMIYRSSFVKREGSYQIWYTGASWGMKCGIGYVEGLLTSLVPAEQQPRDDQPTSRVIEDAAGLAKYMIWRTVPPRIFRALLHAKRVLRGGNSR